MSDPDPADVDADDELLDDLAAGLPVPDDDPGAQTAAEMAERLRHPAGKLRAHIRGKQ